MAHALGAVTQTRLMYGADGAMVAVGTEYTLRIETP